MTRLEHARTFPVPVAVAYAVVAPVPLPAVLGRRHLAIPGVVRVDQERPWPEELGQRRVLHFSDGGRATEVLTVLEPPARFGYRLEDVRGPMRLVSASVDGLWVFEPDGEGTRVTWSWELRPTLVGRPVMPVFARMWRGMADRCFDRIGEQIDGPALSG